MHMILTATTRDLLGHVGSLPLRLIERLIAADARHRERHKLQAMPEERLRDMGIPRVLPRGLPPRATTPPAG